MFVLHKRTILLCCVFLVSVKDVVGQKCNGGANCIVLENCRGLYAQLQQGTTRRLTELLRGLHCGFDESNRPMICCPPAFVNPILESVDPLKLLPDNKVCGIQNNDRITGGVQTEIDEHPWMALLQYTKPVGTGFYCGGVLISPKYVLTAAHCVGSDLPPGWKLSQVRLGEWDISSPIDCVEDDCSPTPQDIPVEEIIRHEQYDTEDVNQLHDIALLRLARNAQYNDFVKPICLPLTEELKQNTFIGQYMEVAGWGKTENTSESEVKLKTRVPVVSLSQCANVFQKVNRAVKNTQICAGGVSGRDSCRGDSGGPLMGHSQQANNWIAVGVVSYGPSPCGTEGWPGVYTRVGAYVDWILSKLRP